MSPAHLPGFPSLICRNLFPNSFDNTAAFDYCNERQRDPIDFISSAGTRFARPDSSKVLHIFTETLF